MKPKKGHIQSLPHQKAGTAFLARREAAGLFDEQGLGKTKQLIDAIMQCLREGTLDGAVIICPNHLKTTWREEVAKHAPDVIAVVLGAGRAARRRALGNLKGTFYIVNYEAVAREQVVLQALLKFKGFALVLDESHRIKAPDAAVTRAVHSLRHHAKRRYILTGTPVANRPEDIWSQIFFLDDGASLGATFENFAQAYGNARSGYLNLDGLAARLDAVSVRRTKASAIALPQKQVVRLSTPLTGHQLQMYGKMREETRLWVESLTGEQVLEQADSILKRLVRLVQLASNPALVDAGFAEDAAKFTALDEFLERCLAKSKAQKVIIWSSFVENVNLLWKRYERFGSVRIHGGVRRDQREANVARFRADPSIRVLVANPAAAREGLTLTQATVALYVDRTFNLVDYLQSQDRIHRLGQREKCQVVLLVAPNTVDEYVDFCLEQKARVAQFVQGDRDAIAPNDALFQKPAVVAALLH